MRTLQKTVMAIFVSIIMLVAYILYISLYGQGPSPPLPPSHEISEESYVESATVTVLVDNNPDYSLKSPWGVSMHVKTQDLSVLFDAGPDPQALKENSEKLNVDLSTLDFAVVSHEHGDHVSGLSYVAEVNRNLTVYVPQHMSGSCKAWIEGLGFNVIEIETTTMISKGIAIIGELHGPPYEQAMAINVKDLGFVVLVGCSHPGVDNMVSKALEDLKSRPYAVMGGFHLGGASSDKIRVIAQNLVETGLRKIYPIHCSGEKFRKYLKEYHSEVYGDGKVGLKLVFKGDST